MVWQSTSKYLDVDKLQRVLERKFQTSAGHDFKIKVRRRSPMFCSGIFAEAQTLPTDHLVCTA